MGDRQRLGRPASHRRAVPRPPHEAPKTDPGKGTFVTDGIESALAHARAVAGDKKVSVCAADVAQQYLAAGLLDVVEVGDPVGLDDAGLLECDRPSPQMVEQADAAPE